MTTTLFDITRTTSNPSQPRYVYQERVVGRLYRADLAIVKVITSYRAAGSDGDWTLAHTESHRFDDSEAALAFAAV